jgi:hypothetical protein
MQLRGSVGGFMLGVLRKKAKVGLFGFLQRRWLTSS